MLWRDVLEAFIALRERNLVAGAEALLSGRLPALHGGLLPRPWPVPYAAPCARQLVPADAPAASAPRRGGRSRRDDRHYGPYVETPAGEAVGAKTYLRMTDDEEQVELAMYPADTLSQARAFFTDPAAVAGVARLREQPGWHVGPNFHFGHMQRGFCWTTTERPVDEYLELWTNEIHDAGNVPREEWDEYWAWLEDERIATPEDRPEFDRHFTHTQRQTASPRPGTAPCATVAARRSRGLGRARRAARPGARRARHCAPSVRRASAALRHRTPARGHVRSPDRRPARTLDRRMHKGRPGCRRAACGRSPPASEAANGAARASCRTNRSGVREVRQSARRGPGCSDAEP